MLFRPIKVSSLSVSRIIHKWVRAIKEENWNTWKIASAQLMNLTYRICAGEGDKKEIKKIWEILCEVDEQIVHENPVEARTLAVLAGLLNARVDE